MEPLTAGDPQTVGGFRLRARLGAGGMGRVYLATSPAGRLVAIKVIHPELSDDQDFARRFRGEADAAQRVSGIYTALVVAAGVDDKPPWLATAFVPGPSLESIVAQYGPLPPAALWRLGAGLAEALRAIHAAGLVHRDLKPPNVILALDGPRVIDFGIARAVTDDRQTAAGSVIGTPAYMSPEQVEGQAAGPPADVFALGCVLGFAAAGSSPFDGGPDASPASIMYRVARGEPDLATVPPEARDLIAACLAKDTARRPDPGKIAAQCAAATSAAGASPAAFWPNDVAAFIRSQQAAVNAQVQALVSPPPGADPAGLSPPPGADPAGLPGPGAHPATHLAESLPPGELAARDARLPVPGLLTATIESGAPAPPRSQPPYPSHPAPATRGTSRRGLLIGTGIGVATAIGGGTAWALSGGPGPAKSSPAKPNPGKPGTAAWTFATGSQAVDADPAVADGAVYFGGSNNELYAATVAAGAKLWATSVSKVSAVPTAANGLVFASAEQGAFYALHAASGKQAWSVAGDLQLDPHKRDFATDGKRVALALGDLSVRMYDAVTGAKIWAVTTPVDSGFGQIIALNGDIVYAFSLLGTLLALNAANGNQLGDFGKPLANGNLGTEVLVSGGALYFGAAGGPLYAIDIAGGHVKWTYTPGSGSFPASNPVIADGVIYFADNNGLVHAVSAANGGRIWKYFTGGLDGTGPGVGDGQVYVPTNSGLRQLNGKTGKPGWLYSPAAGTLFTSTPVVTAGLVLCGNADGNFYAIRA